MPLVYRGRCTACGWESPHTPETYTAVRVTDFAWEQLPHPGEAATLAEAGLTWDQAVAQGRILDVRTVVCTACGMPSETPVVRPDDHPFVYLLLLVFSAVMGFGYLAYQTPYRFLTTCAIFAVLAVLYRLWSVRRAAGHQEALPPPVCPQGCDAELLSLSDAVGRMLPCPECGSRTARWSRWGAG